MSNLTRGPGQHQARIIQECSRFGRQHGVFQNRERNIGKGRSRSRRYHSHGNLHRSYGSAQQRIGRRPHHDLLRQVRNMDDVSIGAGTHPLSEYVSLSAESNFTILHPMWHLLQNPIFRFCYPCSPLHSDRGFYIFERYKFSTTYRQHPVIADVYYIVTDTITVHILIRTDTRTIFLFIREKYDFFIHLVLCLPILHTWLTC